MNIIRILWSQETFVMRHTRGPICFAQILLLRLSQWRVEMGMEVERPEKVSPRLARVCAGEKGAPGWHGERVVVIRGFFLLLFHSNSTEHGD